MYTQERTSAILQIQGAMQRYASLAKENCDFQEMSKLFEPHGSYHLADGRVVSPKEMSVVIRGNEAKYIRHHITTMDVRFVSDAEAHTKALFFAATNYKFYDHWGRWEDVFSRQEDGSWLIRKRTIIIEGFDESGWVAEVYGKEALVTNPAS